jgi:hypothetical protein
LEAKLKATTKALGEADKKHAEEVVATKLAADWAVKEAEARATKAEKGIAEVSKKQSRREEAIVKCIDDLLTSFGSKYRLTMSSLVLLLSLCILNGYFFVMPQNNLEKLSDFIRVKPKILYWMPLACWSRTVGTSGTFSRRLDMCFPACLLGCSGRRGRRCQQVT